jgi:hypothetical protein
MEWWELPFPRIAVWQYDQNLVIRDQGNHIRVEYGRPVNVELSIARRKARRCYEIIDLVGELYSDVSNTQRGFGRLLVNTAIDYLQTLSDPGFERVVGKVHHVEDYDPPGHATVREKFFRDHGGREGQSGEWFALVADLKMIPSFVPSERERGRVTPSIEQFRLVRD